MTAGRPRVHTVWRAVHVSSPIPHRVSSDAFLSSVVYRATTAINRDIQVRAAILPPQLSAVWISTSDLELVEYSPAVPAVSAVLGVLHEIGHILCNHGSEIERQHTTLASAYTDGLSPELINRFFARGGKEIRALIREEKEAEMYARIMYRRALRVFAEERTAPELVRFNIVAPPRIFGDV